MPDNPIYRKDSAPDFLSGKTTNTKYIHILFEKYTYI
ncbi:hypothetical protein FUAX_12660 [Fulvitalea axinellae]|uniref:Uncharacterized protein n=1 Tax=Fulvitalea axinellae TaxID=1182444 RepID=A0AAU9C9W2_9BACT|nr:hypothetical protein FUAX_12660 [Fulvitalea axinellae]